MSSVALSAKSFAEKSIGHPIYPAMAPRKHKEKPSTEDPLQLRVGQVGRVQGYQKANLKRAEERLRNLIARNAKPQVIAEQQAKVAKLRGNHQQWSGAYGYHKEAEAHRQLMEEMESFLDTPPQSRAEGEIGPDSQGGAGPVPDPVPEQQEEAPPKRIRFDPFGLDGGEISMDENDLNQIFEAMDTVNQSDLEIIQANEQYLSSLGINDDMASVQQVMRSGGSRYEDGHIICEYSRLFYTWGYNFTALDITDSKSAANTPVKQKWICTPLAYVPESLSFTKYYR